MAQNQYEVEIKLGLNKSTQLLDQEIEKIDKTLTDKMSKLNKLFEESIKGLNLTPQERFSKRADFLQKNSSSTQSLQSQKEAFLSKKAQIDEMLGEITNIGSVNSRFDTIGKYLAERIDFIKQLDSWIGQYTKQITEFKPVIVAAEQQKTYQQRIKNEREKAAKTGKIDYKAETMSRRNLTEEQYDKEIDALSKYYETNSKAASVEEDRIAQQKEARFADEMKKIANQQKKSKMSDVEFEKRRPQIEKDVRAYVDKTHAAGIRTLAGSDKWGRKVQVRGFQEGFVKDAQGRYIDANGHVVKGTDTSVLRTTAFAPFITNEGNYVSATNGEGELKKSIRVYDPRLANTGNVGRVGDLRNKTYTGIESSYSSLLNQLKVLENNGKQNTDEYQKISQLVTLIPEVIKDAYTNTSSKEIKTIFEDALTGMKSGITALEAEESSIGESLYKNSELSSTLRDLLKLKTKAAKIQGWEIDALPEAPTQDKTDRTDEKQIKRDQISVKQQEVIDLKHKEELWQSIKNAKESTYDDKGELLLMGIKDFLAGLSGDKEQLHEAVLSLIEQIVQTTGVDIDAKQQMNEVIAQQSINVPIMYKGEERKDTLEDAIADSLKESEDTLEGAVIGTSSAKYQAVLEEQRKRMAGRLSEGFQRIQSALAFLQTGTAEDEAVKKTIERINWLSDIAEEIGQPELAESLRKIAEGNPRFTGMDANTIANSISKIYAFSEGMDASLSYNLNNLNQARQAQGLKPIKEEKYREKFFKEHPEIAQKYEESKAARERYDSVDSDNISDKLQAFFSVVGQTEEGFNKFIVILSKAYENLNGIISKVVNTDEGERRATAPAKKWAEDTVEYRISSSGNAFNPNKGVNAFYYEREGIKGQDVNWEEITSNPSPALTTNLQNKAGLTGNIYGGNTPQENAEIAKSILESKRKELERVKALVANPKSEASKNKNLKRIQEIQAEIDFHYNNWNELVLAQTPVIRKSKKNTSNKDDFDASAVAPIDAETERIKTLKESVKQSGFAKGSSFTAKNSVRRTFGGVITDIKGEGARQVVEALLEDGKTVKYTFESLLKLLITYSEQAATTVGDTSEQIKDNIVLDAQQIEQTTESTVNSKTVETDTTSDALKQEESSVNDANAALNEHETEVLSAVDAEQQKVLVSQDLVKQLAEEENAFDKVSESAKESEIQKGVTYTYKDLQSYDDATHTYTDINGNKLRSITQLGGALKGFIPSATAIADEKAFMAAIAGTPKGEQLTAEKVGMTAQDFAKKKNAIISREKGNLEHEVFDLLSKTGFSGIEGFAGKLVDIKWNGKTETVDAQEQFNRVLREKSEFLSKLGVENAEELLVSAIESYTKAIDQAHIQLTQFSETPMAASFSGPKGTFDYSFTPDQIARSSDGSPQNFILDTKTGKTYGTESFLLAGQLYGILANAQNPAFLKLYQESGIDVDKDFTLFIADVKDGFTQLIQHMALTEEEFYDLLVRANDIIDGDAEPLTKDEQATLMNREMTTGRVFGRVEKEKAVNNDFVSYPVSETGVIDKREAQLITGYLTEVQKLDSLFAELSNLKKQKDSLSSDWSDFTDDEAKLLDSVIAAQKKAIQAQQYLMKQKGFTTSMVNDRVAIGKTILSQLGTDELIAKSNRIQALKEVKEAKQDSLISTKLNIGQTKDLDQIMKQYDELLGLRNKLKESELKAEGLTGDKQASEQAYSELLRSHIADLEKILTINGEIVDSKKLEEEITSATYLTESERKAKLDSIRKSVNKASQVSATTDTKYALSAKNNNPTLQNLIDGYYKNLEELGRLDREIIRALNKGNSLTGNAAIENKSFINSLQAQKANLANQYKYDEQKKTLNGIELTEELINRLEQERTRILNNNSLEIDKIGDSLNLSKGFLTQLKDNFKDSFAQIGNAVMSLISFQEIQKVFNDFISATERLDQKMVDLQIASGYTKSSIHDMMLEFNDLGKEIGKTTEEVAEAANDWLRAGYSGEQASQLTEASMQLSTLGMISSADATSYLISVLKGWKLEASEIQGVVDRLTAVDMAAAISAGDLAEAMSRASNSAQMAGTNLDRYIAYLTTITDITQKSAASIGESMKTVYSRYQNIAAGKFVAAQSDIESENYNEEEWANLNDVEKALGALGINIRETVSSFKNFDDVMDEIAGNWNTYTDVQKSGITTSLAGTRQRENLLTLFENWDEVKKFEEISSNAYGTAVEKMEAYTDSVEAAKNRITVALEKWTLALNQSDTLMYFYNAVADVSDNLVQWSAAILLAIAALNSVGVGSAFLNVWGKFVLTCVNVTLSMEKASTSFNGYFSLGGAKNLGARIKENVSESYIVALKENYAKSLTNAINSMDTLTTQDKKLLTDCYVPLQNSMLNYEDGIRRNISSILKDTSITDKAAALRLQNILAGLNNAWVDSMLASMGQEELQIRTQQITGGQRSLTEEEKLILATEELARRRREVSTLTVADNLGDSARRNATSAAVTGGLTLARSLGGLLLGGKIGSTLSDNGWASSLGSLVGGIIGNQAASKFGAAFTGALASGTSTISSSLMAGFSALGGPLGIALGALLIGGVVSAIKSHKEKIVKEAKQAFSNAATEANDAKSLVTTAKKYDELSKGVDSLGRNISLTDEEYELFLEYSNLLVEVFPELRLRTDENGNAIAYLGNESETTADKVQSLVDNLENLANWSMTRGEQGSLVLQSALDEAKDSYNEIVKNSSVSENLIITSDGRVSKLENELASLQEGRKTFVDTYGEDAQLGFFSPYKYKSTDEYDKEIEKKKAEIKKAEKEASNVRGEFDNYNAQLTNLLESSKKEMSEYGIAYANTLTQFKELDDETSEIAKNAISEIDPFKIENGKAIALSADEYRVQVEETINAAQNMFGKGAGKILLGIATDENLNSESVAAVEQAQQNVVDYLRRTFGDNWYEDENKMRVLIGLGFNLDDEGNILNIMDTLQSEFGVIQENGTKLSLANLSLMRMEDVKLAYEWLKEGIIDINTEMLTVVQLLQSTKGVTSGDWVTRYGYLMDRTGQHETLSDRTKSFFSNSNWENQNIDEVFATESPETRQAIKNISESLKEGIYEAGSEGFDEAVEAMATSDLSAVFSNWSSYMEDWQNTVFPELDGVEGHISTFEELQTALKETALCFEDLSDAQTEQAEKGKLTLSTVLDLLTANSNYISLLEFEKETVTDAYGQDYEHIKAIKLKKNAAEEMASAQLLSALASAMLTVQQLQETKATMEARAEAVYKTLADRNATAALYGEATGEYAALIAKQESAEGSVEASKAIAHYAGIIGGLLNMLDHFATTGLSGSLAAYKEGYNQAKSLAENISVNVKDYAGKLAKTQQDYESWMEVYANFTNEELVAEFKSLTGLTGPDGRKMQGQIDNVQSQIDVWKYFYQNLDVSDFTGAGKWLSNEGFKKAAKDAGKTADDTKDKVLDLLKAYDSLIDKEWEAMKVFDEDNLVSTGYTKYFEKKRASLEKLAAYYEGLMENSNLTEEERLDAEKNYIEAQKEINNLDDEEVEDKYKILELYGASINSLIAMKKELVKTSDTYEELLENQKDLNSLLQDEIDLRKEVAEWQQKLSDRELEYVKGSAWSNSSLYDEVMNASLAEIEKLIESTKASIEFNFREAVRGYMTEGMSMEDARAYVSQGNSEYSQKYREAQQTYLDLIDSKTEYVVNRTSAQIEELSHKLQLLEDSKPQEWIRISDIESYYASRSILLLNQVNVYEKALEDVSDLTDDQIKDLVDGLNEATVALHEAKISALEDKTELQEKQYDAIVYRINLYKDELQDAIDAIEAAYEDEIKPLEDANKERERAIELENLLLAKKNANKEKERVYREGIGWVNRLPLMDYIG